MTWSPISFGLSLGNKEDNTLLFQKLSIKVILLLKTDGKVVNSCIEDFLKWGFDELAEIGPIFEE